MPAARTRVSTVQGFSGALWMAESARKSVGWRSARKMPGWFFASGE
jgi:hypothetical protein